MKLAVNLFVCLVHEKPDVIWDMVRNLRYLDPSSHVLLYNNSGGLELLSDTRFSGDPQVKIYPTPRVHAYGVLHGFMLDCMKWALDNMEFDVITNVDSDQLLMRCGYSERVSNILQNHPNLGMLHSIAHARTDISKWWGYRYHVPIATARKEWTAWLPFLNKFESGASQFPKWAFWPSSVFSRPTAQSIVEIVESSEYFRYLMKRTRIFATEEIILPTLVSLLGFELVPTPFDETCHRWRTEHSVDLVAESLTIPDRFWIHPVPRNLDDPLRALIREHHNNYGD